MKASRVFVTGGGGFLGRCLVPLLKQKGHEVDAPSSSECDLTLANSLDPWTRPYEKITWGKLDIDTPKFVIESDATIVAPLMFAWILGW